MFLTRIFCKFLCGGPLENQPLGWRVSLLNKLKYEKNIKIWNPYWHIFNRDKGTLPFSIEPLAFLWHGIRIWFVIPSHEILLSGAVSMTWFLLCRSAIRIGQQRKGITFSFLIPWRPLHSLSLSFLCKDESCCRSWVPLGCMYLIYFRCCRRREV